MTNVRGKIASPARRSSDSTPPQPLQVIFPSLRMYDNVFQVGGRIGLVGLQEDVHQTLESGGSPMQAEGKDPVLPMATRG